MSFDQLEAFSRVFASIAFNSIWQGAAVAAAVWIALRVHAPASAAARHRVWAATLAAVALLPVGLWMTGYGSGLVAAPASSPSAASGDAPIGRPADEFATSARSDVPPAAVAEGRAAEARGLELRLPEGVPAGRVTLVLLLGALAAAAFRLGRLAFGLVLCRRIRRDSEPVPEDVERRLSGWRQVYPFGRLAELRASDRVHQPMVLGYLKPLVLLPPALPGQLSDQELDHVVLHELAHVRRRDDWAVLAERAIEALFAFHPVVFWIGRRLELEREAACDEWVVSVTGRPRGYARSLLKLAELGLAPSSLALAPGALERRSQLAARIERLVAIAEGKLPRARFASAASIATAALTLASCALFAPVIGFSNAGPEPAASAVSTVPDRSAGRSESAGSGDWREESESAIALDDTRFENSDARRAALTALDGRPGTVIVMDPQTGRVLTIVNQRWAVARGFTPASTIKLVTTLAAIESGTFDPAERMSVQGFDKTLTLDEAMAYSNNDYFQRIGERSGFERFARIAREVGLGEKTGIGIPGEIGGKLPDAPDQTSLDTLFGAGAECEVTPIQLAAFVSAIANGGKLLEPVLAAPGAPDPAPRVRRDLNGRIPDLNRLVPGLRGAVKYGTARSAASEQYPIAGKTGTANLPGGKRLGLFASYHDVEQPRLAVVVVLIGDVMGATAAEAAAQIYRLLLEG